MEFFVVILGILFGCLLGLSWFAGSDAPFIPTKNVRVRKILTTAGVKEGMEFWELGSGDGRVVIEAAKIGAISYGIEQSWIRVLYSKWKARNSENANFIHGNIFSSLRGAKRRSNLLNADVVFIFLLSKGVAKLEPILKKTLKKDSVVITQTFHFKNWKPYKKVLFKERDIPNSSLGKNLLEGDFWIYRV